jgi:lysyl-tRNA synthetase class II
VGASHIHSSGSPFARQWLTKTRSHFNEDSTKVSVDTRLLNSQRFGKHVFVTNNLHGYVQAYIRKEPCRQELEHLSDTSFRAITVERKTEN